MPELFIPYTFWVLDKYCLYINLGVNLATTIPCCKTALRFVSEMYFAPPPVPILSNSVNNNLSNWRGHFRGLRDRHTHRTSIPHHGTT